MAIRDIATFSSNWEENHWKTPVFDYSRALCFMGFASFLQDVYDGRWMKLVELNEALIRVMFDWPDLCSKMVRASDLSVKGDGSDLPPFERNGIAIA